MYRPEYFNKALQKNERNKLHNKGWDIFHL